MKAVQFSLAGLTAGHLLFRISPVIENMATGTLEADRDKYISMQAAIVQIWQQDFKTIKHHIFWLVTSD
jgi:hypothetical protein